VAISRSCLRAGLNRTQNCQVADSDEPTRAFDVGAPAATFTRGLESQRRIRPRRSRYLIRTEEAGANSPRGLVLSGGPHRGDVLTLTTS